MKRTFKVSTKLDKKGTAKETNLTMDYTGVTLEELIGPAEDSLVIIWQGRKRRAKVIPASETIKVKEMIAGLGKRQVQVATPEGLKSAFENMSAEEKAKFMEMLKAATQTPPPAQK